MATISRRAPVRTAAVRVDVAGADPADLIDLFAAAKLVRGRKHEHPHSQVMQRYANPRRGRMAGGVRVVLPTVIHAGRRLTTAAAVAAWQAKCDALAQAASAAPPETPRQRRRAHDRAAGRL